MKLLKQVTDKVVSIFFVGCFGLSGPFRQYFSLYWAISMRDGEEKEREKIDERKNAQITPTHTSPVGHCPTIKGRFLLFQVYRNFANLFSQLSVSTFYKEKSKFQQKVQSLKN